MSMKAKILNKSEIAAMFDKPKMSDGEKAARLYIGRKINERRDKIERRFLFVWACLAIGAIVSPFLIMGTM